MTLLLTPRRLLLLGLLPALSCWAQERPFLDLADQLFNEEMPSYRTNLCDRQELLRAGEVELPYALSGLNLTVAITNYQRANENALFTLVDGKIKEQDPGIYAVILDELARRAQFSWRDSYAAFPPVNPDKFESHKGKSWSDKVEFEINKFDISMEFWVKGAARMSRGISFTEGWFPASIILVESVDLDQDLVVRDIWSFLDPFDGDLWGCIILAVFWTGVAYWALERLNKRTEKTGSGRLPLSSVFLSAITFTGHFNFWPGTSPAQILTFSWSFWSLTTTSAYVANLASFLVSRRQAVFSVSSIEEAVLAGASVCVPAGTFIHDFLSERYPRLTLVPKASEQENFDALLLDPSEGGCHVAAAFEGIFDMYEVSDFNADCRLRSERRVVNFVSAGLATVVDTGNQCTSLVSSVLDYHLYQMKGAGFFDQAWDDHVLGISENECTADIYQSSSAESTNDDSKFSLGLADMGGIFIFHAIFWAIAVLLTLLQYKFPKFLTGEDIESKAEKQKKADLKKSPQDMTKKDSAADSAKGGDPQGFKFVVM